MSVNINVKGPWVLTSALNVTNPATQESELGNALDICNEGDIYTAIHYVGFTITVINALGMFMAGTRLALPYMFRKPLWPNVYKPLLVSILSIVVFQPLIMFLWTLCFGNSLHERDQLAVILASALPTWTFSFHFVRWRVGHICLARLIQVVVTILATITMDINTRIYSTVPLDRSLNDYGSAFYVHWSGMSEIFANFACFIIGGIVTQLAYPKGVKQRFSWVMAVIFKLGPLFSMTVYTMFVLFLAIICPQSYEAENGPIWGCAILQPITGLLIGIILGKIFKLDWQQSVTIAITTAGQNVQYIIGTLINNYSNKQIFQSIITYPVLLYVCEIFWMGLFVILLQHSWRLIPSLKNKVEHERDPNPDIHRDVYYNIKRQVKCDQENLVEQRDFQPRVWREKREQIYAKKLTVNKIM